MEVVVVEAGRADAILGEAEEDTIGAAAVVVEVVVADGTAWLNSQYQTPRLVMVLVWEVVEAEVVARSFVPPEQQRWKNQKQMVRWTVLAAAKYLLLPRLVLRVAKTQSHNFASKPQFHLGRQNGFHRQSCVSQSRPHYDRTHTFVQDLGEIVYAL